MVLVVDIKNYNSRIPSAESQYQHFNIVMYCDKIKMYVRQNIMLIKIYFWWQLELDVYEATNYLGLATII